MWGKLNQMVSGDQQRIDNLQLQLEEEQQRSKTINDQFKKVLREKEKEIQRLKSGIGSSSETASNGVTDDREEMREELMKLQRKVEEHQMLNMQKDENLHVLMEQLKEAEELKDQVEAQERVNSEKLMFELAGRIESHEKISIKLEEVKAVLQERDVAVAEMADEVSAKDQMLKTKDIAIKKLRSLSPNTIDPEELLEKEMEIEKLKNSISYLEKENNTLLSSNNDAGTSDENIQSLMGKINLKDEYIETLLKEKNEFSNKIKMHEEQEETFKNEINEKMDNIAELQTLTRNLESESKSLHSNIVASNNEIENLQKLLEQSEHKSTMLEVECEELNKEHALKLDELKNIHEQFKLAELEAISFREKYHVAISESTRFKEQLDKVGEELSKQVDAEKKEKEILQDQNKEVVKMKEAISILTDENKVLHHTNQEIELLNKELDKNNNEYKTKMSNLENMLAASHSQNESSKRETKKAQSELHSIKTLLDSSNDSSNLLTKQLSERDENEHVLCAEISQLQTDNVNLNKSITDLEATIVQLDHDINSFQTNINDCKIREEELQKGLQKAAEEKKVMENHVIETQQALQEFVQNCDSRKRSREKSFMDVKSRCESEIPVKSNNTTLAKDIGDNVLSEVLQILEEERLGLEQLLQIAIKEKNDFQEKNHELEASLHAEREKFDKVLEKSSKLQAELAVNGDEKNALLFKLEEEITSLHSLLKSTEKQCQILSGKESEMKSCIQSLENNLALKEQEIINLQQHSLKLTSTLEDSNASSQEEISRLQIKINMLEKENEELESKRNDKEVECNSLCEALNREVQLKADLENAIQTLTSQISTLEEEMQLFKEQNDNYATLTGTQAMKDEELTITNTTLESELLQKYNELENLVSMLKDKELEIGSMKENLQSKEAVLQGLDQSIKEQQQQYASLKIRHANLQKDVSNKDEDIKVINSSLKLKEDSMNSLSEILDKELEVKAELKNTLQTFKLQISTLEEEIKLLKEQNDSYAKLSSTQAMKDEELTLSNKTLKSELLLKVNEYESMASMLKNKEMKINSINENLKSKDAVMEILDQSIEEIQEKYSSLQELHTNLQMDVSNKEEDIRVINSNLISKEDYIKLLLDQIEILNQENNSMKNKEKSLNLMASNNQELMNVANLNLKSKEDSVKKALEQVDELQNEIRSMKEQDKSLNKTVAEKEDQLKIARNSLDKHKTIIERLKEEMYKTEVDYQNDLREAEEIYSDIQKQYENSLESKEAIQNILNSKNDELDELLAERKSMILKNNEEKSDLKTNFYEEMEKKDKWFEIHLAEKDGEIKELKVTVTELKESLIQIKQDSEAVAENLSKEIAELSSKSGILEQSLNHKNEELLMTMKTKEIFDDLLKENNNEIEMLKDNLVTEDEKLNSILGELSVFKQKEIEWNKKSLIENEKVTILAESEIKISSLETEIEQLKVDFAEVTEGKIRGDTALTEKDSELTKLCFHFETLIDEKQITANDLNTMLKEKEEAIIKLKEQLQTATVEKSIQIEQIVSEKEEMNINFESILNEKEHKILELNSSINNQESIIVDIEGQLKDIQDKAKESIETELMLHQSEAGQLKVEIEESRVTNANLQKDIQLHLEENTGMHKFLREKEELICSLQENLQNKIQECNQSQSNYQNDLRESNEESTQLVNNLYKTIEDKTKEIEIFKVKATKKLKDMTKELKGHKVIINELKEKEVSLLKEKGEFEDVLANNVGELKEMMAKCDELNSTKLEKADLLVVIDEMKLKFSESQLYCGKLEGNTKNLEDEVSGLQQLLSEQVACSKIQEENITILSVEMRSKEEQLSTMKSTLDDSVSSNEMHNIIIEKETNIENHLLKISELEETLSCQYTRYDEICFDIKEKDAAMTLMNDQLISLKDNECKYSDSLKEVRIKLEEKEKEFLQLSETYHFQDENLKTVQNEHDVLFEQLVGLRKEIFEKNEEIKSSSDTLSTIQQQYQTLKEKTVRSMKKSQAMKKVITEKQKEVELLKSKVAAVEAEDLEREELVINLKNDIKVLNTENHDIKELVEKLVYELKTFKVACKNKDIQINELNNIISQCNQNISAPVSPSQFAESTIIIRDISVTDNSQSEISVSNTVQELEWDPSEYHDKPHRSVDINTFSPINQDRVNETLCSMEIPFSEAPMGFSDIPVDESSQRSENISEDQQSHQLNQSMLETSKNDVAQLIPKEIIDDIKSEELHGEIQQLQQSLNEARNKNALMKKAQIELAKEIELLQEAANQKELENNKFREELNILQGELKLSVTSKHEIRKMEDAYQSLTEELNNKCIDCERIVGEKSENEEVIEGLKLKNQELQLLNENFLKSVTELCFELDGEGNEEIDTDFNFMHTSGEQLGNIQNKAMKENLKFVKEKVKKEKLDLLESLENEKLAYQKKKEEEKLEALRAHEILIRKENSEEIDLLKQELDLIEERQLNADNLREEERILKDRALNELELLREQITTDICERQQFTEASQECQDNLLGEIERELIEVKDRLKSSNAKGNELEEAMKCEELLKRQYMKENEILKADINFVKEEQQQQQSVVANDVEDVRKHKDIVIKKLKSKLRKEISEKEKLNESLTEAVEINSTITEKEGIINNLEDEICQKTRENEEISKESMKRIMEKDDLINALKDELSWLKESMAPLVTKADNADILLKDNQYLKYCVETKDNEVIHLKDHALLKENELTYLLDQEKRVQDEYLAQVEKLQVKNEEKETSIKALKDEIQWLQNQVDDLSPKSEQLISALDDVNAFKENLNKEVSLCKNLESQLHAFELKIEEKENINNDLQDHCHLLQIQLDNLLSNKDEIEELNANLKEMEELYSSKNEKLEQMNESLLTREAQVEDLRAEIIEKQSAYEDLQGILQNKDIENYQIRSMLEEETRAIYEKEAFIEELSNSVNQEQEHVLVLNNKIMEISKSLKHKSIEKDNLIEKIHNMEQVNFELKHVEESLGGIIENKTLEYDQRCAAFNELDQMNKDKSILIDELISKLNYEEEHVSELNSSYENLTNTIKIKTLENDNLVKKLQYFENLDSEYQEMKTINSNQQQVTLKLEESFQTKDQELENLKAESKNSKVALQEIEEKLQNSKAEVEKLHITLDKKTKSIEENDILLENHISNINDNLNELFEMLNEKDINNSNSIESISFIKVNDSGQTDVSSKDVQDRENILEHIKRKIEEQKVDISQTHHNLHQEKMASQEKDSLVYDLKDQLKMRDKLISNLNKDITDINGLISSKDLENQNLLCRIQTLQNELEAFSVKDLQMESELKADNDKLLNESTMNNAELDLIRNLLQEKQREISDLELHNADLLKGNENLQLEYENSINQLQESIHEKDALYDNSLQKVKIVKEMLEEKIDCESLGQVESFPSKTMKVIDIVSSADEISKDQGMGWDDAYGWGNIDSIEIEQPVKSDNTDAVHKITNLKEDIVKLNELCEHKDAIITKLKNKMRQIVAEKDQWKEKCANIGEFEASCKEVSALKESIEKIKEDKDHKDTIITKLKLKLKQTIKGRDQLKENLQSELDRISQEKDLIFNEFSEKLQQQNIEVNDLRNGSEVLSKTLKAVEGNLLHKEKDVERLQFLLDDKTKDVGKINTILSELTIKCNEVEMENTKLNLLTKENDDIVEKYQSEIYEKDNHISNLDTELMKFRNDIKYAEDIRSTLEEAMEIKDQSLEKMRQQQENLQQEYVKLNAERRSSLNKNQIVTDEYEEKMTAMKEKVSYYQEEKQNMAIKADEYKAEIEAVEILIGFSKENGSLIEQVGSWQIQTTSKLREYERSFKNQQLESKHIQTLLKNTEKLCNVPEDGNLSLIHRLQNIQGFIRKLKGELKSKVSIHHGIESVKPTEDTEKSEKQNSESDFLNEDKGYSSNDNITYQLLDDKFKAFTTLTEELQKALSLCKDNEGPTEKNVTNVETPSLKHSQTIIEEISLIKSQLEEDISYSKTEWIHLQSENRNLKKQINLLTNSSDEIRSLNEPNVENIISKKNKAFLEVQDTFENVINQKDSVIDALRKRINELREQMFNLLKVSSELQLSESLLTNKDEAISKMAKEILKLKTENTILVEKLDDIHKENIANNSESITSGMRENIEFLLMEKKQRDDNKVNKCKELENKLKTLQIELDDSINLLNVKETLIQQKDKIINNLQKPREDLSEFTSKEDIQAETNIDEQMQIMTNEEEQPILSSGNRIGENYDNAKDCEVYQSKYEEDIQIILQNIEKSFDVTSVFTLPLTNRLETIQDVILKSKEDVIRDKEQIKELLQVQSENKELKTKMNNTMNILESKNTCLNETIEELREKSNECNDLIEENLEYKEEINDLKESIQENNNDNHYYNHLNDQIKSLTMLTEKLEKNINDADEKVSSLQNSKLSYESQLREKDHLVTKKDNDISQLTAESEEKCSQLQNLQSIIVQGTSIKEELEKDNTHILNELVDVQTENANLKKQIDLLTSPSGDAESDNESKLQNVITKKNEAFLELRDSFEDVITQKDNVIDTLRKSIIKYRDQCFKVPQKYQEDLQLSETISSEKDNKISILTKERDDLEIKNTWLKEELDRIITEKQNIGGVIKSNFASISSGLRGDLELALKERNEYGSTIEIHCLEMEREMKILKEELSVCVGKLKGKEHLILEKNMVISNLQNQVENTSDKVFYRNLQQQLDKSIDNVENLSKENNTLIEQFSQLNEIHESLKLEVELMTNEKNQMKLESESQVEYILIKNAEDLQNLRNSFEESLKEKDTQISLLSEFVTNHEEQHNANIQLEQDLQLSKLKDIEESYKNRISDLEIQLDDMLTEKEAKVNEILINTEKHESEQLTNLRSDYDSLLSAKDEKIKYVSSQFSENLIKSVELNEMIETYKQSEEELDRTVKSKENEIRSLIAENKNLRDNKASEIEQTIISKGKQLKDLRDEFETVFNEKNSIIENIRATLKSSREELVQAQYNIRESNDNNRNLEQKIIEIETDKLKLEAKVSSLVEYKVKANSDLINAKQESKENKAYIEDILIENSKLKLSCEEFENVLGDVNSTSKEKVFYTDDNLVLENQSLMTQLKQLDGSSDRLDLYDTEKDEKIKKLKNDLQDLRNDFAEKEDILININGILEAVIGVNVPNDSLSFLPERVQDVVNKLLASHRYCDEFSEKLFGLMEPNQIKNITSRYSPSEINTSEALSDEETSIMSNDEPSPDLAVGKFPLDIELKISRPEVVDLMVNQLSDNISHKDKHVENLENDLTGLKKDSLVLQNILNSVSSIIENVSDVSDYDGSITGVHEKVEHLVNKLSLSQKYCDELSKKLYELMEKNSVQDFSSQCYDEGKEIVLKSFEDHINYLQKELVRAVDEKESIECTVIEKYDDIMENLRGDLEESNKGYTLLQEENFSLKTQLDVFTNASMKQLHQDQLQSKLMESTNIISGEILSPKTNVNILESVSESEEMHGKLGVKEEKEISVLKSTIVKLKKLCRKYKDESQSHKVGLDQQADEVVILKLQVTTLNEFVSEEKLRYEKEIMTLREEINVLVVEKESMVESFKNRNQNEIFQLKEMYQISLNQYTHDIQIKDNLIEKYASEIDRLTNNKTLLTDNDVSIDPHTILLKGNDKILNLTPTNQSDISIHDETDKTIDSPEPKQKEDIGKFCGLEESDLIKKVKIMEDRVIRLNEEKMSSEARVKSQREEITDFVEERDKLVALWHSKFDSINEEKNQITIKLRNEIEELSKRLLQAQHDTTILNDNTPGREGTFTDEESRHGLDYIEGDRNYSEKEELRMKLDDKTGKLKSDIIQHFPATQIEVDILQSQNTEKDMQLQEYQKALSEIQLKLNDEHRVINSLTQNITCLKSEKMELENRLRKEFELAFQDLVNQNNILHQEKITNEKIMQDVRSQLQASVSEKEYLVSEKNLQLPSSEQVAHDYLKYQLEQLKCEKEESANNYERLINELKSELGSMSRERAEYSLRTITLRALLEQEVKDHEKTTLNKTQIDQNQGLVMNTFKSNISDLKYNLKSVRSDIDTNLSIMKYTYNNFVLSVIPSMINEDYELLKNELKKKNEEVEQKVTIMNEVKHQKQVAESRLLDVVAALQELGAIEKVQKILLERESSLKAIHNLSANELEDIEDLRRRLEDKEKIIAENEDKIAALEDSIRIWHGQYFNVEPMNGVSSQGVSSQYSEIDWPDSEQSSMVSDIGSSSMVFVSSRSVEPSTPTIGRN